MWYILYINKEIKKMTDKELIKKIKEWLMNNIKEYPMTINSIELIEDNKKLLNYINNNIKGN